MIIISANAFALPLSQGKVESHLTAAPAAAPACADFSGTWNGVCTTTGQAPKADSFVIKQLGCSALYIDRDFYSIGGARTETHAIPMPDGDVYSAAVTYVNWNADRSGMISVTDVKIDKVGVGTTYADRIYGASSLVGGKLISDIKGTGWATHCEFN
jgi:hypothetical protein